MINAKRELEIVFYESTDDRKIASDQEDIKMWEAFKINSLWVDMMWIIKII